MNPIHVGTDIGQITDPTAIAIVEVERIVKPLNGVEMKETLYKVHSLERMKLRTPYPEVATRITEILCSTRLSGRRVRCYIDTGGVGRAVFDDVRDRLFRRSDTRMIDLREVTLTGGEQQYNQAKGTVSKARLVDKLSALYESDRVHVPTGTREFTALRGELKSFSRKQSQNGHLSFNAEAGAHDDLLVSLALACMSDPFSNSSGGVMMPEPPDPLERMPTSRMAELMLEDERMDWWL